MYSRMEYEYEGGSRVFPTNFAMGVLEKNHLTAYVRGELDGAGEQVYRLFLWDSATGNVTLIDDLPSPATVVIDRTVPKDVLYVEFAKGAEVNKRNLDRQTIHAVMAVHEVLDGRWYLSEEVQAVLDQLNIVKEEVEATAIVAQQAAATAIAAADRAEDAAAVVSPRDFDTRSALVAYVLTNPTLPQGTELRSGGLAYIVHAGGPGIPESANIRPLGDVYIEHFSDAWSVDAGVGLRLAEAYLFSIGGGCIHAMEKGYPLASSVERSVWLNISPTENTVTPGQYCAFFRNGVSLKGIPGKTRFFRSGGGISSIFILEAWSGRMTGFELQGAGSANNSHHGISNANPGTAPTPFYIMDGAVFEDLKVSNVGSYGIGFQGSIQRNCKIRRCLIENTGADGIDWKVRALTYAEVLDSTYGNTITDTVVRNPAQREAVRSNSAGIGVRGQVAVDNVQVFGVLSGGAGIDFSPGIATASEARDPAHRSVLTNFLIEAANPATATTGILIRTAMPVVIGNGKLVGCNLDNIIPSTTPYGLSDGPSISNVIVEGARGQNAFRLSQPSTHLSGCRALSEKQYFGNKRGNTTAGQTILPIKYGTNTGVSGLNVVVIKNGVTLTLTTQYTIQPTTITLVTPLVLTDEIVVVFPALRAVRVEADYCNITGGGADRFIPNGVSYSADQFRDSGASLGFLHETRPALTQLPSETAAILYASGPANTPLQTQGSGTAPHRINRPLMLNVPISATGLPSDTVYVTGTDLQKVP